LTKPEKTVDWNLDDLVGFPIEDVRKIREEVEKRVKQLIRQLA